MTTSISVRNLRTIKHITNKYALLSMYFLKTTNIDVSIKAIIIRKIHLVNELKINLFIDNGILDFEKTDIFNSTELAHIDSCDVTISIINQIKSKSQIKLVHTIKVFTLLLRIKCLILIHHMSF